MYKNKKLVVLGIKLSSSGLKATYSLHQLSAGLSYLSTNIIIQQALEWGKVHRVKVTNWLWTIVLKLRWESNGTLQWLSLTFTSVKPLVFAFHMSFHISVYWLIMARKRVILGVQKARRFTSGRWLGRTDGEGSCSCPVWNQKVTYVMWRFLKANQVVLVPNS